MFGCGQIMTEYISDFCMFLFSQCVCVHDFQMAF